MKATTQPLPEAIIYTDGSSGVNGHGGWAAIVATPFYGLEITGFEENTTNNRMELMAAIRGMSLLHAPHQVNLVSDSAYMLRTIEHKWYEKWFKEQALQVNHKPLNKPRPNLDLWRDIESLLCYHIVKPIKVKGHTGIAHNERVDKLAVAARVQQQGHIEVLYGNITEA